MLLAHLLRAPRLLLPLDALHLLLAQLLLAPRLLLPLDALQLLLAHLLLTLRHVVLAPHLEILQRVVVTCLVLLGIRFQCGSTLLALCGGAERHR